MGELDNLRPRQDNQRILEENNEEAENLWLEMSVYYALQGGRRTYYNNNKIKFQYPRLRKLLGPLVDEYTRYDLGGVSQL